jgi:hypothetical protein
VISVHGEDVRRDVLGSERGRSPAILDGRGDRLAGTPWIRSIETFENPAAPGGPERGLGLVPASEPRPSVFSTTGSNDWIPSERRFTPAARYPARRAVSATSGFASREISASAATPSAAAIPSSTRLTSPGSHSDGVPAAEVDRIERPLLPCGTPCDPEPQLGKHRVRVARARDRPGDGDGEVAVRAPAQQYGKCT